MREGDACTIVVVGADSAGIEFLAGFTTSLKSLVCSGKVMLVSVPFLNRTSKYTCCPISSRFVICPMDHPCLLQNSTVVRSPYSGYLTSPDMMSVHQYVQSGLICMYLSCYDTARITVNRFHRRALHSLLKTSAH